MNRNIRTVMIWAAFLGLAILSGWRSSVFDDRALDMIYEIGFLVAAAAWLSLFSPRSTRERRDIHASGHGFY